jgi:hypothetical protein
MPILLHFTSQTLGLSPYLLTYSMPSSFSLSLQQPWTQLPGVLNWTMSQPPDWSLFHHAGLANPTLPPQSALQTSKLPLWKTLWGKSQLQPSPQVSCDLRPLYLMPTISSHLTVPHSFLRASPLSLPTTPAWYSSSISHPGVHSVYWISVLQCLI